MTRNRLILAALWILSLVGISFYGGPVSYGFFVVITLIPIVSLAYLTLVYTRFKIYQHFECPEIVANHVVPFYFTLQNEDFFSFSGIRVTFHSDFSSIEGLSDDIEYELLPKTKIKKQTGLICRYRGEYLVGIKSVTLRDYLCLFNITYNNKEPLRATVIPDIIKVDSIKGFDTDTVSDRETTASLSHPDVTVRDYAPGDDIRRINWKQTARVGKLTVRNYIGEEKDGVGIIIDTERISDHITEYLPIENRILEIAISTTLFLIGKNIPIWAYTCHNGINEIPVDSSETFNEFYNIISRISFDALLDRSRMFAELSARRSLFSRRLVFIITADAGDEVTSFAGTLNESNIDVIVYLVKNAGKETSQTDIFPHTRLFTVPAEGSLEDLL